MLYINTTELRLETQTIRIVFNPFPILHRFWDTGIARYWSTTAAIPTFSHFCSIPACDGRTDRRTDLLR